METDPLPTAYVVEGTNPDPARGWPDALAIAPVAARQGAPILLAALALGLVIGLIQAATSVNEQTLTFVPKLGAVAFVLVVFGASMMALVTDFTQDIFVEIAQIGD